MTDIFEGHIRQAARKWLPSGVRRPLGRLAGGLRDKVLRPLQGLIFDLRGGRFRVDGCEIDVPKGLTSRAYRSCFLTGEYEAEERSLVREFVRAEDSVLELGACMGVVSCVTNRRLRDTTRHVVVEGNPRLIPTLQRNRELNACGFIIENCAASNQSEVTFFLHPVYVVGGSTQRESKDSVRIPGRSWRELDRSYGPFTVLIMDVEGSELEVLEGSRELIASYRLVIAELHEWAIGTEKVQRCRELLLAGGLQFAKRVGITEAWKRST
jgi:FkbM family methyltransferase